MPTRKNSSIAIKIRRTGALERLEHPSANLKARVALFTPDQLKKHNARVESEIAVLKNRIGRAS